MKQKKVSIKDVARESNVSISTVSRVLRKYSNVPRETEKIVMEAVKKLNYIPNIAAQSLTQGSLNNIGVVFTRSAENAFVNPFFSNVLSGIGHITQHHGYYMQLLSFNDLEEEKAECSRLLLSGRIDGLIILSSRVHDSLIYTLLSNNSKFVLSGRILDNSDYKERLYSVNTDNIGDSFEITKHLIKLGHKKIAIVNGPMEYVVNKDRYDGYRKALLWGGIEHDTDLEIEGGYDIKDAKRAVMEKLRKKPDITAIFAKDDIKAVGTIKGVKELGLRVPEDIAVVGYNDYEIATIVEPNLTTMKVPIFELGMESAKMLMKLLQNEEIENKEKIIPTELIIRDSCGYRNKGNYLL